MPAVTTPAQVCNLALGLVGQRQFIDSLTEESVEAQVCARYYATVRNALLAKRWWRFAKKRAVLALTTEEREGWGFCYTQPTDLLVARYIWTGKRRPARGEGCPFEVELNDAATGHLVCTDMEDAELVYTVELATVALWRPLFVDAVAAELAVRLAGAIPVKPQLMPMLQQNAFQRLMEAAAADANEAADDEEPDSEFILERG